MFIEKIFQNLQVNPSKPWIHEVHGKTLKTFSKKDFFAMVGKARAYFQKFGLRKGDRVVLLGSNTAQWIACDLAIISFGAITVPLYSRQDPKELTFMANDCEPSLFIFSDEILNMEIRKYWETRCPSIYLGQLFSSIQVDRTPPTFQRDAAATIIYTSGTSGNPKGVILSHKNIDFMLTRTTKQLYAAKKDQTNNDRVFHFLPLCFAGSRLMLWTQMYRNNPVHLSIDLKNLVEEMSTAAPMFYLNVPAILERIRTGVETKIREKGGLVLNLYRSAIELGAKQNRTTEENLKFSLLSFFILRSIRKKIGKNLRFLICGSAALHPDTQKWFNLIGIQVLQVYGLTETTGIISMDDPNDVQTGLVGKPVDGVQIKISPEGELLAKGANIFPGYWKRNEETTKSFDTEGWFKTGDLAEVTSDNHIRITGRLKNLIIPTSGHNIVPETIEEQLQRYCAKIEHAVLIGHGKPFLSVIVTGSATVEEIQQAIDQVNQNVPHYRKIKTFIFDKDGLTIENGLLTANQKIKRQAVETHFHSQIENMYAGVQA